MNITNIKLIPLVVRCLSLCTLLISFSTHAEPVKPESVKQETITATLKTSMGSIKLELFNDKAPETVKNFIQYANSGFYNNTLFHRVIPGFMVQAGGFDKSFARKTTKAPIKNEAKPFVPNKRGTIAMARTSNPHSATSQFFINVNDNNSLNKTRANAGYAVFGKVIEGMIIADQISSVKTGVQNRMGDVPVKPIVILSITISELSKHDGSEKIKE